jgi:hypothetical protein
MRSPLSHLSPDASEGMVREPDRGRIREAVHGHESDDELSQVEKEGTTGIPIAGRLAAQRWPR